MKKTTLALLITVVTASTLFSTVTQAEGPSGEQWHQQGGHDGHGSQDGPDRGRDRGHDDRGGDRGDRRGGYGNDDDRGRGAEHHYESGDRFAWQGHDFRRGHPMPPRFRGDDYRVNDWNDRGLREPPRGEHWAYIDGNYVLIAAATGVITSILLNHAFH